MKKIFPIKFKFKKTFFQFFLKNKAGRNNLGSKTILSKGCRKLKKKSVSQGFFLNLKKSLFVVIFLFFNNGKLFSILKQSSGLLNVLPSISGVGIGNFIFCSILPNKFWFFNKPGLITLIKNVHNYVLFSCLTLNRKPKIALANGTFCQIYENFIEYNFYKIMLPSKQFKLVSGWNLVILGRNNLLKHNKIFLSKAGTLKSFGKKSKVRGVAMNPVDHPHGGRTKTNQPEKSIWGWVAKRNK